MALSEDAAASNQEHTVSTRQNPAHAEGHALAIIVDQTRAADHLWPMVRSTDEGIRITLLDQEAMPAWAG
jgi:hypothetical protein